MLRSPLIVSPLNAVVAEVVLIFMSEFVAGAYINSKVPSLILLLPFVDCTISTVGPIWALELL